MSLDNFRNRTIIWDTVNKDFPQPIQIMQGDVNARTLSVKIVDNGVEIDLTGHSLKLTYQYTNSSNSGFVMIPPKDLAKGEFILVIPTEMTTTGVIEANLILLNESLEQVIVSKNLTFISDNSTVTDLAQEVNNKIDDFTKLLLENMPQVLRSELNDLHAQTESNKSNIELKANLADMTSLQSAMTELKNEVEAFGISHENLVTIKSLLEAIARNASESEVVELINSVKVLTSNISLMSNGDYSPKANQTDLESLQHTVNDHSATVSAKANQTDLDNLQATVDKQGIAISTKAEQSELSITNKNVTTAQETANKAESEAKNAMAKAAEAQANSLPLTGNAVSASKLATPRKLGVNLQSSSFQDFDGTADATNIGVTGVLPVANGGTSTADGVINIIAYANSADGTDGFTTVYPNLNLLKNTRTLTATSTSLAWNTLFSSSQIYDSTIKSKTGVSAMTLSFDVFVPLNAAVGSGVSIQLKGQSSQAPNVWGDDHNTIICLTNYIIKQSDLGKTIRISAPILKGGNYRTFDTALADTDSITIRQATGTPGFVYSKLKLEEGSTATPYMPSASEVTINDYPKYVGFSNIIKPNKKSSDYNWLPRWLVSIDSATGSLKPAFNFNKISAALQSTWTISTTITQANFVLGKAIDGKGVEITANAKFLLSEAITPWSDKITLTNITNVATYLLYQLSYYDLSGTFISQSTWTVVSNNEILLDTSIDYTTVRIGLITSTTPSTKQMVYWTSGAYPNHTFTLNFKKLVANADNNNYGFVKPDGITTYIESGLLKAHPFGNAVNPDNLITVAKSNGMETVVQEAIRKCTNDDTIVIYPGTYDEQLNTADNTYGNKSSFKSLVGVDREKCIITSHKDDYGVEALWVSKGYFKNLSVLADDAADVDPARNAYAMHADNNWLVNSKAIFENCYFYSKTTAAVGIGTRPGCDIIFRNCKFYTEHNLNAGGSHVGAVFFHNSNDGVNKGPNQRITFDNCEIISKYGSAMKVQRVGDDTNTVELTMKNCSLWSEETGLTNVITIDDTLYTGVSGNNININGKTFGNNVDITTFIHA